MNGLPVTEEALFTDLEKSKAKWTLEETLRYRRAGNSPIYVSGKYLTKTSVCPATGESDAGRTSKPAGTRLSSKGATLPATEISEEAFLKVLHGKGFSVRVSKNLLTGEIEREVPASIENLNLKFSAIPGNASAVHVIQTSPQIQVSMSLEKFLELARISPNGN